MAGISHSAFRRLVSDFGGCDTLYTEMLSAKTLPRELPETSPSIRRRPGNTPLVYQLLVCAPEEIRPALKRLAPLAPDAIDLNLGCPAPEIRRMGGGAALFRDPPRLERILGELRQAWDGVLIVKLRLGDPGESWQRVLTQRLALFGRIGVEALVVHPRMSDEKLKRRARWEQLEWIAQQTPIPLTGNGDITSPEDIGTLHARYPFIRAFMLGRLAAVRPWIFAQAAGLPLSVDPAEIWRRMHGYIIEDFEPVRRLGRMVEFTEFFSRNYAFGNDLFTAVRTSATMDQAVERADLFFGQGHELLAVPSIASL